MERAIARQIVVGSPFSFDFIEPPSRDEPSRKLQEARKPIEQYIVTVDHKTAWDDVVGNEEARRVLIETIEEPRKNPDLYEFYGMKPAKGVLLYGPPGCGKTMFAKAAAAAVSRINGSKSEVLLVNGPSIQTPYVGQTEEIIRNIFAYARAYHEVHKHPLTVFIDEADAILPDRTGRNRRVAPWEESNVAQFLSEMDGLNSNGAFVILATNRPEAIDEALLRDGRCDRKIKIRRPDREACVKILWNGLDGAPVAAPISDLVTAGVEALLDPHYVIHSGHVISTLLDKSGQPEVKDRAINFCLEHIVSGAMVAGLPRRAKAYAFRRDLSEGTRSGIQVQDILSAVKEVFEENKGLEHSFAVNEFIEEQVGLEKAAMRKGMN